MHMARELAVWYLCPEREQKVAEAPIDLAGSRRAVARILRAPRPVGQMIFRCTVEYGMTDRFVLRQIVGIDMARMQEAEVGSVDLPLQGLQVVAVALNEADLDLVLRHVEDLKTGELGRLGARTHVNPN